jgi:glycosyltransferase involved in cell wall biosynthesis
MRVAIDGRPLVGNRTGIGVHVAEIASRLQSETVIAAHAPIDDLSGLEHSRIIVDPTPLGVLWQQLRFAGLARRDRCDVVWGPHGTLPWNLRTPAVVSMHDLTSLTMPGAHRLKTILSFNVFIGRSLDLAKHIAAVSRTTADEIVRRFAVPAAKIEIVPNGVSDFFRPRTTARDDFILYVGTREPRKGIDDLLAAYERLPAPRPPLVLAGDPGWKMQHVSTMGYVTREQLRDLYSRCAVFVYPSRYEGFGLPPLEAMACAAPVIAARGGAVPEILGDAAVLVPPADPIALAAAMRRVIGDSALRADLSARGMVRAAEFTWDRSARLMEELLSEAAR